MLLFFFVLFFCKLSQAVILPAAVKMHQPKFVVILQQGLKAACNVAMEDKIKNGACASKSIKKKCLSSSSLLQGGLFAREGLHIETLAGAV